MVVNILFGRRSIKLEFMQWICENFGKCDMSHSWWTIEEEKMRVNEHKNADLAKWRFAIDSDVTTRENWVCDRDNFCCLGRVKHAGTKRKVYNAWAAYQPLRDLKVDRGIGVNGLLYVGDRLANWCTQTIAKRGLSGLQALIALTSPM